MKNASSWQFSAPLSKVDISRIIDEAADVETTLGVIKVVIESPKGASTFVIADLDLSARATLHRGVRVPDAIIADDTRLERDVDGIGYVAELIDPRGEEGTSVSLSGQSGLVLFMVQSETEARQLINKLLDKVTVTVEAW